MKKIMAPVFIMVGIVLLMAGLTWSEKKESPSPAPIKYDVNPFDNSIAILDSQVKEVFGDYMLPEMKEGYHIEYTCDEHRNCAIKEMYGATVVYRCRRSISNFPEQNMKWLKMIRSNIVKDMVKQTTYGIEKMMKEPSYRASIQIYNQ